MVHQIIHYTSIIASTKEITPGMSDQDDAYAILNSGPTRGRSGCAFANATAQCPAAVQDAVHATEYDMSIAAPRFRDLFKAYAKIVPGETTIRRHRTGGCNCLKETK